MSALTPILRSRVPTVGKRFEWVELGSSVMRSARKRKGLSYEGAARLLSFSAKTYERWEKKGKVPVHEVPHVADVLGLEIERPDPVSVNLGPAPVSDEEARSSEILRRLGRIEHALGISPETPG